MEAVFAKDVRGLFPSPSTPKTFYHPTPPKGKKLTLPPRTATTTATAKPRLPKADILTSLPPSLVDVSPSPPLSSAPSWDLRQGPLRHGDRETAEEASELSPGGGSKFNESWPSVSEQEGVASGVEVGTDAGGRKERDAGKSKEEEEEEGNANTSKEDSTLARYIERFRCAPPTSRDHRGVPGESFWWVEGAKRAGEFPASPTPPASSGKGQGCGTHDHTHTDPSPEVSGEEGSLESRSQELLEKCSSLLTSSLESPPAQKYLNTLERSPPPPPPPPLTGSTGGGVASGSGFRPGQDGEDILAQWRLRRKLEQARRQSERHAHSLHVSAATQLAGGRGIQREPRPPSGGGSVRVREAEPSLNLLHPAAGPGKIREVPPGNVCLRCHPHVATPPHCVHCTGSICCHHHVTTPTPVMPTPASGVVGSNLRHTAPGEGGGGGGGRGGARQQEVKEQEVQTSPDLLDARPVGGHVPRPAKDTPTHTRDHLVGEMELSLCLSPTPSPLPHPPEERNLKGASSRLDRGVRAMPPLDSRPQPPAHGGLALREVSEEEEENTAFTMSFDTDLDPSRANTLLPGPAGNTTARTCRQQHSTPASSRQKTRIPAHSQPLPHTSSHDDVCIPVPNRYNSKDTTNEEGPPLSIGVVISPPQEAPATTHTCREVAAGTSEESVSPPQRTGDLEASPSGFSWDQDMDDDLLKLLIRRVRLFEGQIREIDSRLMALQEEHQ